MNFCTAGYLRIKSSPNNIIRFIKTSFLEAMKYFRLRIGAIVLFEVFTLAGSQNWKKQRGCQRGAYILVWQRVWIMKLLHDSISDPLKQTKKALWCFAWLTIISDSGCFRHFRGKFQKQTERLKRHSLLSLVGNFQAEIRISCLQTFFPISFRLSRPFFVKRNWLRQMLNAIIERNQNLSVPNPDHHLPKPWSDRFTPVNRRKALCPKACDTASTHRYLPLGTFRQRAARGGCIAEYGSCIFNTMRGLVNCIFLVDRSSGRSLEQQSETGKRSEKYV